MPALYHARSRAHTLKCLLLLKGIAAVAGVTARVAFCSQGEDRRLKLP